MAESEACVVIHVHIPRQWQDGKGRWSASRVLFCSELSPNRPQVTLVVRRSGVETAHNYPGTYVWSTHSPVPAVDILDEMRENVHL